MSSQPFKFRHLDSIVGGFVLAAVAIVIAALALIGVSRQWFTARTTITAATRLADPTRSDFIEEMAESLKPGTPVEFAGRVVGEVREAQAEAGLLRLRLHVANQALAELHPGNNRGDGEAKAVIKVPLAPFMGQTRVVLKPGNQGEKGWLTNDWYKNRDLAIDPPRDSTAMAMAVLRDLEANLGPMMAAVTGLVSESRELVAEIRAQRLPQQAGEMIAGLRERQVPQRLDALLKRIEEIAARTQRLADLAEGIAGDARRITGNLAQGDGIAGRALSDPRLGADLAALVADLRAIMAEVRRAAPTAPGLAEGASTLLDEVQRLVDGLNRHWLLRAYTDPGTGEHIVPSGVLAPPEAKP